MKKRKVFLFSTGGTIEKTYDEHDGTLFNRETVIRESVLKRIRLPYTQVDFKAIMCKDSLHMDDQDRDIIKEAIVNFSKYKTPIIILHGTDTMEVTAKYCFDHIQNLDVPIIFTGAMKPMGFVDSDALQNVIESIYAANLLPPGFYVSFHNHLFKVPNVRKNRKTGTFEKIDD
jgi:L-asparaginase